MHDDGPEDHQDVFGFRYVAKGSNVEHDFGVECQKMWKTQQKLIILKTSQETILAIDLLYLSIFNP